MKLQTSCDLLFALIGFGIIIYCDMTTAAVFRSMFRIADLAGLLCGILYIFYGGLRGTTAVISMGIAICGIILLKFIFA